VNYQRIHYYLVFCDFMHFTNAAKILGISQPALAKSIGLLEEELGTRLVRREGKHTHLTAHGNAAREIYSELMDQVYRIEEKIQKALYPKQEQVRLAINATLNFTLIASFLASYLDAHPKTVIDIVDCNSNDSEDLLLTGKVDCLITADSTILEKKVECIPLYEENLTLANASDFLDNSVSHGVSNELSVSEHLTQHVYSVNNETLTPVISCSQQLWVQQLIKNNVGYGVISEHSDVIDNIRVYGNDSTVRTQTVSAAIPVGRNDSTVITGFIECLKEHSWV